MSRVVERRLPISRYTHIPAGNHCVLFASPDGSRWNDVNRADDGTLYFVAEYVVPKYSLQEEAALLNTMGQDKTFSDAKQSGIETGLRTFSFIPRYILESYRAKKAVMSITEEMQGEKREYPRDEYFERGVSHTLVHFSCPQSDCHNWFVQFASNKARKLILDMFHLGAANNYKGFLTSLATHPESSPIKEAMFHNFVLDAVACGLHIDLPTRIKDHAPPPCLPFQLPEAIGESNIYLRSSTNVLRACLPDISCIDQNKLSPYHTHSDILFQNSLGSRWMPSVELDDQGNHKWPVLWTNQQHVSSSEPPLNYKCFTYSLIPLGAKNTVFGSILLFFKVHLEQTGIIIDAMSVIFIQSTLAPINDICPSGANLMMMWLAIFFRIYELQPSVIFPFLFFVKSPFIEKLSLDGQNPTEFFMDEKNIWVVNGFTGTVQDEEVGYTDRLILDSVVPLLPNTNPLHFRCCFCGLILKADFPNHRCPRLEEEVLPIQLSEKLTTAPWVTNSSRMRKAGVFDPSTVVFTLGREAAQNDPFQHTPPKGCGQHWISLPYPTQGLIPNSRGKGNEIDMIDIVLVDTAQERNDFYPLANDPPEPEPDKDFFKVEYDAPILDLFSYFPPRPVVVEATQGSDVDQREPEGSEDPDDEVKTSNSHLHESLGVVRCWGKKTAIGFARTNGKLHVRPVGVSYPSHKTVAELYENKSIPLAHIFVPMNCLHRLPVTLYGAQKLIPFEIKCLLVGGSTAAADISEQYSMRGHLRRGQPVPLDDLKVIFGQNMMREPLLTKDLGPVHSYRSNMMELNMSDFQLLGSYVNGLHLIVPDILGLCMNYLSRPGQLTPRDMNFLVNYLSDPEEHRNEINKQLASPDQEIESTTQNYLDGLCRRASRTFIYSLRGSTSLIGSLDGKPTLDFIDLNEIITISQTITSDAPVTWAQADVGKTLETTKQQIDINLEVMKTLLENALHIVKQQFQFLVKPYTESNPVTDLTNEDYDLLFRQFLVNPLLDHSRLDELTQFLAGASQIQESAFETALQFVNDQFDSAKQDLDLVFKILRGEEQDVDDTQRTALSGRMAELRSRIFLTLMDLFNGLGNSFRESEREKERKSIHLKLNTDENDAIRRGVHRKEADRVLSSNLNSLSLLLGLAHARHLLPRLSPHFLSSLHSLQQRRVLTPRRPIKRRLRPPLAFHVHSKTLTRRKERKRM
ncbi:hypothetical protein BLNAU_21516 [Blattamonas nauphoetae]|uniref:Uncharacterized protein n=1 Tax=Blattamonas nauphoetae TaxID=2049346 RepID=A0ABQ9WZY1_9EUKA|nr:hypothetical protein BLNAU_21516 [Blattamonas nauphoetae]